jgi:pimeloyl-ACP methyl ester carboxylesterase
MAILRKKPVTASPESKPPRSRVRRWSRRIGITVVLALALIGALSVYRSVTSPPGVGYFRSAEGREEYVGHYQQAMQQLPEPSAVHDISTDYGIVRVYEWSTPETADETPVVLLPGRSSGVPMWSANLPGFVESRRVLAFDPLGDAGLSVQSVPLTSVEDQAAWIDEVIATLAPEGVHLVGHSFSGATAAAYARLHPDRVRSLTLLEPVFTFAYPPAAIFWWATVATLPGMPEGIREYALRQIGGSDEEPAEGDDADPVALMIASATEHFAAELPTPSPLSDEEAAQLTMPVYVGIAGRDSLAGGGAAAHAGEILPDAQVQTWDDATHSLPMQEADELQTILNDFWDASER